MTDRERDEAQDLITGAIAMAQARNLPLEAVCVALLRGASVILLSFGKHKGCLLNLAAVTFDKAVAARDRIPGRPS